MLWVIEASRSYGERKFMECLIRGSRRGAQASLGSFNTGLEDDVVAERSFRALGPGWLFHHR